MVIRHLPFLRSRFYPKQAVPERAQFLGQSPKTLENEPKTPRFSSAKPHRLYFLTNCFASIARFDTFVRRLAQVPNGLTSSSIVCGRY
ncbi:MAG: hypothetical protein ABMA02_13465 [Saprospiraceae bacterium]